MSPDDLKPLEMADRDAINRFLQMDPPETSELTFSNLFMWRNAYHPAWTTHDDMLLVVCRPEGSEPYALPPVGVGDKAAGLRAASRLAAGLGGAGVVARVPESLVEVWVDPAFFEVRHAPEHSDYVYRRRDLVELKGKHYHKRRNHYNRFVARHDFEYRSLDTELVECVLEMQNNWCQLRDCLEHPGLAQEDRAIFEALKHVEHLDFFGGAIVVDGKVEAFSLGEMLSPGVGVVHIEKANTAMSGLYAAINQRFSQEAFAEAEFINREQDLGIPGLRQAKRSYHPHHMVEKYTLVPR